MLAADKLQLQSQLKQQATALKEKEFNLHHTNLMTVGTQAAVLAGLDVTMFIEFNPSRNEEWGEDMALIPRMIKFTYYLMIISAFCANMVVVSHTTVLSVLGAGMALRGPDGSMMTATDGLYEERKAVFFSFGVGLACTVGSVALCVWLMLQWEAALCCMGVTLFACRTIWQNYVRIQQRFAFDENETVDFRDIMEGPAAIQGVPMKAFLAAAKQQAAVAVAATAAASSSSTQSTKKGDDNGKVMYTKQNSSSMSWNMKRASSLPDPLMGNGSDSDWDHESQMPTSKNDELAALTRRGRAPTSPTPDHYIQTV